jgi:xylulokinase
MIISYDVGTGGCKATIFNEDGEMLASTVEEYKLYFPQPLFHEQRPDDWWNAVVSGTRKMLASSGIKPDQIDSIALSGQSLAIVPMAKDGTLLREQIPIWSDTRPGAQTKQYFATVDENEWYMTTGNGFSHECYSIFKIMWMKENEPDLYARTDKFIGSKDYINYRLTGNMVTDHSYASGSGVYDLKARRYDQALLAASGVASDKLPEILDSIDLLGTLTSEAADALGLGTHVKVYAGGVDNSCMSVGAGNVAEGKLYLSLGSSSWIAISGAQPVLDRETRPTVWAHVVPQMFSSQVAIFAAGSSLEWVRRLLAEYDQMAEKDGGSVYGHMDREAAQSTVGANGLLYNPTLAGISAAHPFVVEGAFLGLELRHTRPDIVRAVMEGITMDLALLHDIMVQHTVAEDQLIIVGGGSRSELWRSIFANAFNKRFIGVNTERYAASLGAAAIAAVGSGVWSSFDKIGEVMKQTSVALPDEATAAKYAVVKEAYVNSLKPLAEIYGLMRPMKQL